MIKKMSDEEYFAMEGISQSFLKEFYVNPYKALHKKLKESKALSTGTLVHNYILDHKEFKKKYHIETEKDIEDLKKAYMERTGKESKSITASVEYKEYRKSITDKGQEILSQSQQEMIQEISKNFELFANEYQVGDYTLAQIFKESKKEIVLTTEINDIIYRGKLDVMYIDEFSEKLYIIDLKTIGNLDRIERQIYDFRYYWQEVFYPFLLKKNGYENYTTEFIDVFIETEYPYCIEPVQNGQDLISLGMQEMEIAIDTYIKYRKGEYEPLPYTIKTRLVTKPRWTEYQDVSDIENKIIGAENEEE